MKHEMMEETPIYTFAKWQAKDQPEKILSLLVEVVKETTKEEGNLFYKVHQSNSDKNTFILFEGYKDQSALEAHRNSAHFKTIVLGQIIPLLEKREITTAVEISFPAANFKTGVLRYQIAAETTPSSVLKKALLYRGFTSNRDESDLQHLIKGNTLIFPLRHSHLFYVSDNGTGGLVLCL